MNKTEEMLQRFIQREAQHGRYSRQERRIDIRYYDNLSPAPDKGANDWGRGHNVPRINTIREKVDWVIGHILQTELFERITGGEGTPEDQRRAEILHKQVQSHLYASKHKRVMEHVLRDAAVSGEGIARVRMVKNMNGKWRAQTEYRNWKNLFYDTNYRMDDFIGCQYLFDVSWIDFNRLVNMFPRNKTELEYFRYQVQNDRDPDQSLAEFYGNEQDNVEEFEGYTDKREEVLWGQAWWREPHPDYPDGRTHWAIIAVSNDFTKLKMLTPKKEGYRMNVFPYVRVVAGRYGESGYVYSPIARMRRANDQSLNTLMRTALMLSTRERIMLGDNALNNSGEGEEESTFKEDMRQAKHFSENPGAVAKFKNVDDRAVRTIPNDNKLRHVTGLFEFVSKINDNTGNSIDPSVLNKQSNITSAVGIQEKARHAQLGLHMLSGNYYNARQEIGEMTLAMIRQYDPEKLDFPNFMDDDGGEVVVPENDHFALAEQRLQFQVSPRPEGRESEYMQKTLMEMMKVAPQSAAAILVAQNEVTKAVPTAVMRKTIKQLAMDGVPVPLDNLTREERDEVEGVIAQQKQMQQQSQQIEMMAKMAEIKKNQAEAALAESRARVEMAKLDAQSREGRKVDAEVEKLGAETYAIITEANNPESEGNAPKGWG